MVSILVWIIFGALAGWIISLLVSVGSMEKTLHFIAIGIAGAIAGGIISKLFSSESLETFNPSGVIIAVLSSLILLAAIRKLSV